MRTFIIVALIFFSLAPAALAQSDSVGGSTVSGTSDSVSGTTSQPPAQQPASRSSSITLINPLGSGTSVMSFLTSILNIVTNTIGPVIVILMLVYVGFKFVVAQGEPGKLTEARQALLWTVVGALILLGAKVIALGIEATVRALSTGG